MVRGPEETAYEGHEHSYMIDNETDTLFPTAQDHHEEIRHQCNGNEYEPPGPPHVTKARKRSRIRILSCQSENEAANEKSGNEGNAGISGRKPSANRPARFLTPQHPESRKCRKENGGIDRECESLRRKISRECLYEQTRNKDCQYY